MGRVWTWDEMLRVFRVLGGTAENLVQGSGRLGRGLFPLDTTKPVHLRVPPNLLFPVEDVEFAADRIRIRDKANIAEAERMFFENYENSFSWGAGGFSESNEFIRKLDTLAPEVRALLIAEFGFGDLLEGDFAERSARRFLGSRAIQWGNGRVIVPLIELANHDVGGLPYEMADGLRIGGNVGDEILVNYGAHDSFSLYQTFGFASPEPGCFSLAMRLEFEGLEVIVQREPSRMVQHGNFWIPQRNPDGNRQTLSYLMIGHARFPRLSRGIFRALMREAGMKDPDEGFDQILRFNGKKFLKLLGALEAHDGEIAAALRRTARFQLEAMSYCIGSRELEAEIGSRPRGLESRPAGQEWKISIQ